MMVGITTMHKIFKGRRCIPDTELKAGLISGGSVALAEKLRNNHGWNGMSLLAAPVLTLEAGGIADTHWAVWKISQILKIALLINPENIMVENRIISTLCRCWGP